MIRYKASFVTYSIKKIECIETKECYYEGVSDICYVTKSGTVNKHGRNHTVYDTEEKAKQGLLDNLQSQKNGYMRSVGKIDQRIEKVKGQY